jgi:hypothetical protein
MTKRLLSTGESVYNLEVHGQHIYQVGDIGVLVHNANPICRLKKPKPKKKPIPKSKTGKGSAPKDKRDKKRAWSFLEKLREFRKRSCKCDQCGKKTPISKIKGHHIKRWADGGKTVLKNLALVCAKCHKALHAKPK